MPNFVEYADSTGVLVTMYPKDIPNKEWLRVHLGFRTFEEFLAAQKSEDRVYWKRGESLNRISKILDPKEPRIGRDGANAVEGPFIDSEFSKN
jgi:hypothetical protein